MFVIYRLLLIVAITGATRNRKKRAVGFPITTTQTIYFYDKSAVGPCYVEGNFITINPSPAIDARPIEVLNVMLILY
jgi:hypothetical protein